MAEYLQNNIPIFEKLLPERVVFDMNNEGPFTYVSPMAIDKDNHTISMNFVNMTGHPFIFMQ